MNEDLAWDCRTDAERFQKLQEYCMFLRARLKYVDNEKYKRVIIKKLEEFMKEVEATYVMDKLDSIYKLGCADRCLDNIWAKIKAELDEKEKELEVKE